MNIEAIGEEARKLLRQKVKAIDSSIMIITRNIKGSPLKNIELIFFNQSIEEKCIAIKSVKNMLHEFRQECFDRAI